MFTPQILIGHRYVGSKKQIGSISLEPDHFFDREEGSVMQMEDNTWHVSFGCCEFIIEEDQLWCLYAPQCFPSLGTRPRLPRRLP